MGDRSVRTIKGAGLWVATCAGLLCLGACIGTKGSEYILSQPLEIDTILSAWLIQRYVDTGARFRATAATTSKTPVQGQRPPDAIALRYPVAAGHTQVEQIIEQEHISGPCVSSIQEASRVLEIMAWRKSQFPAVLMLEQKLREVIDAGVNGAPDEEVFQSAFLKIEQWCDQQST